MFRPHLARRVALNAAPVLRVPLRFQSQSQVPGGATLDRREKTLEDRTVRDHEKKLLDDLVAQLAKKDQQLQRAEAALKNSGAAPSADARAHAEAVSSEMDDKLLAFRKEVRSEIHAVEDRLAELDFRLKRLEKRINI